jgi:DNA-binding NtrC family response regulator
MFLDIVCQDNGLQSKTLSETAKAKLMAWNWPGNVRELQNVMERSALLVPDKLLTDDLVLIEGFQKRKQPDFEVGMTVSEAERLLIMKTLDHTSQNRTKAAHILGISIRTLRNKLNEYRKEPSHERTLR